MKRVFLYVRVSTEEQALHGLSIEAQTDALQKWAKSNHHKVVDVYTDAGISARKPASKRPELQRLLKDVQAGKGDLVVFTKLDRWFRNISEYYKVQEVLEKYHVDWKTIHEDYDTSNASGRLKINIMLSVAQDEADRTSERIKASFVVKREKLEPLGGSCPTGYKQKEKKFIKDPETEAAVNAFFQTYLTSGSVSVAQKAAEELGLWLKNQVAYRMLESSCYYGNFYGMDDMTPSYITKEQFDKIQSMRKRIVRKTTHNRIYIFSGIISCGDCGFRMGGRVNQNKTTFSYNCNGHYGKTNRCENRVNLCERKIEEYLLSHIERRLKRTKVEIEKAHATHKSRDYKGEISSIRQKLSKLKDLYLNDFISLQEYKSDYEAYNQKISQIEKEASLAREPDFSEVEKALCKDWKIIYYESDRETKRSFWRTVLREIRIYSDRHIEFDLNVNF